MNLRWSACTSHRCSWSATSLGFEVLRSSRPAGSTLNAEHVFADSLGRELFPRWSDVRVDFLYILARGTERADSPHSSPERDYACTRSKRHDFAVRHTRRASPDSLNCCVLHSTAKDSQTQPKVPQLALSLELKMWAPSFGAIICRLRHGSESTDDCGRRFAGGTCSRQGYGAAHLNLTRVAGTRRSTRDANRARVFRTPPCATNSVTGAGTRCRTRRQSDWAGLLLAELLRPAARLGSGAAAVTR